MAPTTIGSVCTDIQATTRREFILAGFAVPLLAAGCAADRPAPGSGSAPAGSAAGAERDPGVVVVLDDFAALNVMALGVTPDVAYDTFGYATTADVYADAGITPTTYGQSLNLEQLIAADPDVIVGVSLPTTVEQKVRLEQLGTLAILDYAADWQSALRATAKALGREERARRIEERINQQVATLRTDLAGAGLAGTVASVLAGSTESPFSPPAETNLGRLLTSLGLARPAPQRAKVSASAPFVDASAENLDAHDGDVLYLMGGRSYPLDGLKRSTLYPRLEAVRNGKAYEVSGEMWFGANPVSVQWVLDDVRATLLDRGPAQRESAASARLRELVRATG